MLDVQGTGTTFIHLDYTGGELDDVIQNLDYEEIYNTIKSGSNVALVLSHYDENTLLYLKEYDSESIVFCHPTFSEENGMMCLFNIVLLKYGSHYSEYVGG